MPASVESLVHETYVHHFGSVTSSLQALDAVIQEQYAEAAATYSNSSIEYDAFPFYHTGDSYLDSKGLGLFLAHSAMKDITGLIDGLPVANDGAALQSETIKKAYDRLATTATLDSEAAKALKTVFEHSYPDEIDDSPIAVRRPLHVFRLSQADARPDRRTVWPGDTVALPEIVSPRITKLIGEQVVTSQAIISSLAGNAAVAQAITNFRSLHHQLSREHDTKDPFWAPLRTYKEGIVTAAQAVSFMSEGITDERVFSEALLRWRSDKTIETIAYCLPGAILGPLATHGAQPKGGLIRASNSAMRENLKNTLQKISKDRKQKQLSQSVRAVDWADIDISVFGALTPAERAQKLFEKTRYFLPNWGCLAPTSVIRQAADLALAGVIQSE